MFKGIDHVGIGVSDMDRSLRFYGDKLGFTEVLFDYTGPLPGMAPLTGDAEAKARIVMVKSQNPGPIGLGMIKLVQRLEPGNPEPIPAELIWGDIGVAEVCFRVQGVAEKFSELVQQGCRPVLTPGSIGEGSSLAYIEDPDGSLLEFTLMAYICTGMHTEPTIEGINHVGFGVSDANRSIEFYRALGFTEVIKDYTGYLGCMATMFPEPMRLRFTILANYYGAWIEIVQLMPPYTPKRFKRRWGHLGQMDFAIGVSNLERACDEMQNRGVKFIVTPQTLEVPTGQFKYAYIVEPDGLYVALVEARY